MKGPRRRIYAIIAAALVLLPAIALISCNHRVNVDLAEYRKAGHLLGMPRTAGDLNQPEPTENAAELYGRAVALLVPGDSERFTELRRSHDDQAAKEELLRQRDVLTLVRRASAMPACAFPVIFQSSQDPDYAKVVPIKSLAQLLALSAHVKTRDRDWKGAIADIAAIERIGVHLRTIPDEIPLLLSFACTSIANRELAYLLQYSGGNPSVLSLVEQQLDAQKPVAVAHGLKAQWLVGERIPDLVAGVGQAGNAEDTKRAQKFRLGLYVPEAQARYFEALLQCLQTIQNDKLKSSVKLAELQEIEDRVTAKASLVAKMYLAILVPPFDLSFVAIESRNVDRALLKTACRLYGYRNAHGHFPGSPDQELSELDPWTGLHLNYRLEGDGFVLWSSGPDCKDDGGNYRELDQGKAKDHILNIANRTDPTIFRPVYSVRRR